MSKLIRVRYNSTTTLRVTQEVWDVCEKVYTIFLEQDACTEISATDKTKKWYAEVYKGGVGTEEADAIFKKSSLIYLDPVRSGYEFVMIELEKKGAGKRPKKKPDDKRQAEYNQDFVSRMCENYVLSVIKRNPDGWWDNYNKKLKEKYPDAKKAHSRLVERAHNNAFIFRVLLRVLEDEGKLPKTAYV